MYYAYIPIHVKTYRVGAQALGEGGIGVLTGTILTHHFQLVLVVQRTILAVPIVETMRPRKAQRRERTNEIENVQTANAFWRYARRPLSELTPVAYIN